MKLFDCIKYSMRRKRQTSQFIKTASEIYLMKYLKTNFLGLVTKLTTLLHGPSYCFIFENIHSSEMFYLSVKQYILSYKNNVGGVIHHYKGVKCYRENCRKKSYVRLMLENLYLTIGILLQNHD